MPEATVCGNPGFECQKQRENCGFFMTEFVLTIMFASYGFVKAVLQRLQKLS